MGLEAKLLQELIQEMEAQRIRISPHRNSSDEDYCRGLSWAIARTKLKLEKEARDDD